MKRRKPSVYNLLVLEEGQAQIRRVRITPAQLRITIAVVCLGLVFSAFNAIGFWYYRFLHTSLLRERLAYHQYEREKGLLVQKMDRLERTVHETEDWTGKLAGLVGTERPRLKKGIGPLPQARMEIEEMTAKVASLDEKAVSLDERLQELTKIQEEKVLYLAATPSIWPVKGWVTSEYGYRRNPFNFSTDYHEGVDIAAQYGTTVQAAADGVVTYASYRGGLGKVVIIDHGFGISSYYGHTSSLFVHQGQRVKRGMRIAAVGNTGHSTGPHLHYEIHVDGAPVDPMKYILQ